MFVKSNGAVIAFVVRASVNDGLGHLVRSISVLTEIQELADAHMFLLGDLSGRHLIEEAGITWTHCTTDDVCSSLVLEQRPNVVVFDTLRFDRVAFNSLIEHAITVSLSPVFSCMDGIGHLFHRTLHEAPEWQSLKPFPKIYKGLKYTVLPSWLKRVSTKHYHEHLHEKKLSIALSMGGSDAPNRTLALLQELSRYPQNLVIWVALGDAYTHSYEHLLQCAKDNRQEIILLKSNESMWRVLRNASLVICSGGLTTYEAAYVGIPSINIMQSAEWEYLFAELAEKNVCYVLSPSESSIKQTAELVNGLVQNRGKLLDMHKSSKRLIPNGGARRIVKEIMALHTAAG